MIEINSLTKRFGNHIVVDDLSFNCVPGEVLGFLGPNGAGKSTTMKMLTGFVAPSAGGARVCGHDIATDGLAARQKLGYLPEGAPCYAEMTPITFLDFVASIRGLVGATRKARLDEVIERLHLEPVLRQSIDTLSKGFKRRVGLAQAILHDPEVLILDEPTDGLDPNQKHEVRELIHSMATDKLIIISTHILEEVEAVCSRAIIISNGRILADDTPRALASRSRYHNAVRVLAGAGENMDSVAAAITELDSVVATEQDPEHNRLIAVATPESADMQTLHDVTKLVNDRGWSIEGLQLEAGRLDEFFRQITQGERA
ncbi:MAG: ATP-binding cassette domain-containing protein [Gammaproteobacteria bacterium]|nr:ATP-binding cassette domain-containing protein [Gammaproteobacteria bacterium]